MTRIEVITGTRRRRSWSEDEKRALVAAAFAPSAVVSGVARRAEISPGQLYRWRREFEGQSRGFSEVVVAASRRGEGAGASLVEAAIEIALSQTVHVRIPASISPALAAAVVGALRVR